MDTIELDMDGAPEAPVTKSTPLAQALAAVQSATTYQELEAAIIPARTWPEGRDKQALRTALRAREARGFRSAAVPPPVLVTPANPTELQVLSLAWPALWATFGQARTERPYQTALDPVPTAQPRRAMWRQATAIPLVDTASMQADNRSLTEAAEGALRLPERLIGADSGDGGILTGWSGSGELKHTSIVAILASVGMRTDWAPSPKSPHAHATAALQLLTHSGRVLRSERGRKVQYEELPGGTYGFRNYSARWTVGDPQHGQVGDKFGRVVMSAGLTAGGELHLTGEPHLTERVRAEWDRRQAAEVFSAADVTDWLRLMLTRRFGAVRLGTGYYIRGAHAEQAARLCEAVSQRWGKAWIVPALPVSTSNQLRAGLVRGLADEAAAVLDELGAYQKASPLGSVGPKGAATLLAKLRDVYERSKGYADLLGPASVAELRSRLQAAVAVLEPLCDDTAQRFSMMDLV